METTLNILKSISDKNRLRIVNALNRYDELCACQLTELLRISGASVSRHLALLTGSGLLSSRKSGRWIFFSLNRSKMNTPLIHWIDQHTSGSEQLSSDNQTLVEITRVDPEEICRKQRGEACCPKK